jgi:drug/metabolite transporter (DMT)-like permease
LTENDLKNNHLSPHIALLLVQLLFGTLPVIGKVVLKVIPAVSLVGFRVGITAAFLFFVQRFRGNLRLDDKRDYWRLAVLSLFGVTFNQLLFINGLALTKASNTSLLAVTIPIFALTVSSILGVEKLRAVKAAGIAVAAIGVIFLIDPRQASFSSDTTPGDTLIIINSLSYGIYVAISKNTIVRNGALKSITWIFIFASVICVPLGSYSMYASGPGEAAPVIWLLVLHISILATAAPYLLNAWALARVNPSVVAVYVYLQPVIGFMTAILFLGEKLELRAGIAAALIFAGLFLVTKKSRFS